MAPTGSRRPPWTSLHFVQCLVTLGPFDSEVLIGPARVGTGECCDAFEQTPGRRRRGELCIGLRLGCHRSRSSGRDHQPLFFSAASVAMMLSRAVRARCRTHEAGLGNVVANERCGQPGEVDRRVLRRDRVRRRACPDCGRPSRARRCGALGSGTTERLTCTSSSTHRCSPAPSSTSTGRSGAAIESGSPSWSAMTVLM